DARTKRASPAVQTEKGADDRVQVRPPSRVTAGTRPLAPPFAQRACCPTPTRCKGARGSAAPPPSPAGVREGRADFWPSQPAEKGLSPETRTAKGDGWTGRRSAAVSRTAAAPMTIERRTRVV